MYSAVAGFALSLSFIVAIGAQNTFVLRQGLRRAHVLPVVVICAISDAILIAAGVAGFGALIVAMPGLEQIMRVFGATFLIWYGSRSLLSASRGGQKANLSADPGSLKTTILTCLALTWLNPHVYLDTLVLLGAVSSQYDNRVWFGVGAALASALYFVALGYGARGLAPLFARPSAWRWLDLGVGVTMILIAAMLLSQGISSDR